MDNNKTENINGKILYTGISAGVKNLLEYQDKLDEINVFPVPDGDTGTNMCFTLLPIIEDCPTEIPNDIDTSINFIANTALDSARGNSGTIIAQFFHGMRKALSGLEFANINNFADALQVGYQSANDSLLNPEEGTIITVMRDVSNALSSTDYQKSKILTIFLEYLVIPL